MIITSAQYHHNKEPDGTILDSDAIIIATIDSSEMFVPCQVGNRHYDEILRQVADGIITIQDAD